MSATDATAGEDRAEDVSTEYRVMWWSEDHARWFPHTATNTDRPKVAEAWLEQAIHRGPGGDRTAAFIEVRSATPWTRVAPAVIGGGS